LKAQSRGVFCNQARDAGVLHGKGRVASIAEEKDRRVGSLWIGGQDERVSALDSIDQP
jgi:hypothetical protein